MDTKNITKPFDLKLAKQGAPVATESGLPVEILKWDALSVETTIVGLVTTTPDLQAVARWDTAGSPAVSLPQEWRLVMAPLGYCEGKPVFAGDKLLDARGTPFTAPLNGIYSPTPNYEVCTWPKVPNWPQTTMRFNDFDRVLMSAKAKQGVALDIANAIANAAIAHACESGQVVPADMLDKVAIRVRDELIKHIDRYSFGASNYCLTQIDLPAIIKSVREAA